MYIHTYIYNINRTLAHNKIRHILLGVRPLENRQVRINLSVFSLRFLSQRPENRSGCLLSNISSATVIVFLGQYITFSRPCVPHVCSTRGGDTLIHFAFVIYIIYVCLYVYLVCVSSRQLYTNKRTSQTSSFISFPVRNPIYSVVPLRFPIFIYLFF